MRQILILISGEAWTGKSTISKILYTKLNNSAWLDGDDVWRVNPWDLNDARLRNSDLNMSFVIENYLKSKFEYIILSSIVLCVKEIKERIINLIDYQDFNQLHFTLICNEIELKRRAKIRDNNTCPSFLFLEKSMNIEDSIKIDTTNKLKEDTVNEIIEIIRKKQG